jgi:NADH-quinone oxidoreductase subunit L
MAGLAVLASGSGALLAWLLYARFPQAPVSLRRAFAGLHGLVERKYYVDEIYDALIIRPTLRFSEAVLYRRIDAGVIDETLVNGAARSVRFLAADVLRHFQSGFAQAYLFVMVLGAIVIVGYLVR